MTSKTLWERLREHWLAQNITIKPGVHEEALSRFETLYTVLLPRDLREYFLVMNGMREGTTDEELIRFWSLEEVKSISEESPAYSTPDYLPEADSFFLFADYSIWAHAYSIRISNNSSQPNPVYVIGGTKPVPIADSFSEFVDLYLDGKCLDFQVV